MNRADARSKFARAIRERLVKVGLAEPSAGRIRLGQWIDAYIDTQTELNSNSLLDDERTRRRLVDHFGEDRALETIPKGDAGEWRIWLATQSNHRDKNRSTLVD